MGLILVGLRNGALQAPCSQFGLTSDSVFFNQALNPVCLAQGDLILKFVSAAHLLKSIKSVFQNFLK